jgi:hypothetical protein
MAEMDSGILYIDSPEILFFTCQWAYPIGFYSMPKTLSNATTIQVGYLTWGTGENENAKKVLTLSAVMEGRLPNFVYAPALCSIHFFPLVDCSLKRNLLVVTRESGWCTY